MVLNELEKYQIEVLIERLETLYPNELDKSLVLELKDKMLHSDQDFIILSRELNAIFQDKSKLEEVLLKYGLNRKEKKLEKNNILDDEVQAKLNFVQMHFPHNKILVSPNSNIFEIEGEPNNIAVEVMGQKGHYVLKQTEYNNKFQANELVSITKPIETINEIKHEYSIEQLEKITEGMTQEEIVEYLKIHGKNQQQIMMILLSLEEAKEKKKTIQLEQPKQLVLTKPTKRGKMAAFIDTLYLSFFVGVISGATFFIILRIILHSL